MVEVNPALGDHPELVNQDPYGEGWMLLIEPAESGELQRLLSLVDYRRLIGEPAN